MQTEKIRLANALVTLRNIAQQEKIRADTAEEISYWESWETEATALMEPYGDPVDRVDLSRVNETEPMNLGIVPEEETL